VRRLVVASDMLSMGAAEGAGSGNRLAVGRRLRAAIGWLTTPLLPDDYLGLVNPLWSARQPRGRVEAVLPETVDAATLVIRPGRGWAPHRAGQYVRVGVDLAGVRHWRSYSLSSPPERADGRITITVKADPHGLVSPYLVGRVTPGTIVHLAAAQGEFTLPEPPPDRLLFLTAGSGITPVAAMLRGLVARGQMPDMVLVHSAPTSEEVIFGAELRALATRLPRLRLYERHTSAGGRITVAPGGGAGWRCRGPARFTVSDRQADAGGATPLLVVGENAGVLMPSRCRVGICYSCVARLRAGRVRDLRTGHEHGDEGELIRTRVSAATGPVGIDL
jgi:stearoyl-CoA 9-desaturase NADPH oxidoreductase